MIEIMIFFLIIILRLTRVGISYLHTYKDETYRYVCVCVTAFVHAHVCMCVRFLPPYVRASVYGTQLHLFPQTHAQLPNESARITASPSPPPASGTSSSRLPTSATRTASARSRSSWSMALISCLKWFFSLFSS